MPYLPGPSRGLPALRPKHDVRRKFLAATAGKLLLLVSVGSRNENLPARLRRRCVMVGPFDTLLVLVNQLRDLDMVEEWIDEIRITSPTDQEMQLNMDRQQVEVDQKRT